MKQQREGFKKYKASLGLKKDIRRILIRGFYHVSFSVEDGQLYCCTNCPSDAFHKVVQRAKCEKQSEKDGVLYVTEAEAANVAFVTDLMRTKGVTSYLIIDKETVV